MLLPISPPKMQIKINSGNKTINLINDGQVSLLKETELTEIEFEFEVPQMKYPYAKYKKGFVRAQYYLDYLENLKSKNKPFQFIVFRSLPTVKYTKPSKSGYISANIITVGDKIKTNMRVTLEDYTITEDAKNGFDFTIKVKLKQYREYKTKTAKIKVVKDKPKASTEKTRETDNAPQPAAAQQYTVVKGDCLWAIANHFYGNGSLYSIIYDANVAVIGGNPNLIYPGQVLTIPAI
jgi:nucleoid-associated protein YgaU